MIARLPSPNPPENRALREARRAAAALLPGTSTPSQPTWPLWKAWLLTAWVAVVAAGYFASMLSG